MFFKDLLAELDLLYLSSFVVICQIRRWGNVEWAHDYDMYELQARTAAGALFVHLSSESSTVKHKLMQDWSAGSGNRPGNIQTVGSHGSGAASHSRLLSGHLNLRSVFLFVGFLKCCNSSLSVGTFWTRLVLNPFKIKRHVSKYQAHLSRSLSVSNLLTVHVFQLLSVLTATSSWNIPMISQFTIENMFVGFNLCPQMLQVEESKFYW